MATTKRKPTRKPVRKTARKVARKPARKAVRKTASLAQRVRKAAALSKAFHGRAPRKVTRARAPQTVVGMVLGRLEAVEYRVADGQRYRHEFRGASQPTLAATHDGRKLFVVKGRYQMTARGIVDKRKR